MPDHIAHEIDRLEPSAQAVVRLLWHFHEQQMAELRKLREQLAERDAKLAERDAELAAKQAQIDKRQKIVFGPRTEKMPPIKSEVRRKVEAEAPLIAIPADATAQKIAEATAKGRHKQGRKAFEAARQNRN